jgi:hypothetical protein
MTKPSVGSRRLEGMRHSIRLLPIMFVFGIAACSASPGGTTPSSAPPSAPLVARPSTSLKPDSGAIGANYSGILSMDEIEGGCTYLQADDGRKLQVIYPEGWELKKSPLELLAPDGSVHSKGGDRVSINGSVANDIATICQIGPVIRATEVLGN